MKMDDEENREALRYSRHVVSIANAIWDAAADRDPLTIATALARTTAIIVNRSPPPDGVR
jgi:hypothetical protein